MKMHYRLKNYVSYVYVSINMLNYFTEHILCIQQLYQNQVWGHKMYCYFKAGLFWFQPLVTASTNWSRVSDPQCCYRPAFNNAVVYIVMM